VIGIDVVDIERLRRMLEEVPRLEHRLFNDCERAYCQGRGDRVRHLAGTLAAKEAVMKALGVGSLPAWARRIEITRETSGAPVVKIVGREDEQVAVSITHDGRVAAAAAFRLQTR
jgi:holo-[acyl-carrier protein] synthase